MKKVLLGLFLLIGTFTLSSQQLYFEVFTGGNKTNFGSPDLSESQWFVPVGVRLAGGLEHLQLGVEYKQNVKNPVFVNTLDSREFNERYYGAFLRGNISSVPAYAFGLILKAGAGYYEVSETVSLLEQNLSETLNYKKHLGLNGGIGISVPIHSIVHSEFSYQYNYVDLERDPSNAKQSNTSYHSFQFGLSINLVFGNVADKCRKNRRKMRRKGGPKGWKNF